MPRANASVPLASPCKESFIPLHAREQPNPSYFLSSYRLYVDMITRFDNSLFPLSAIYARVPWFNRSITHKCMQKFLPPSKLLIYTASSCKYCQSILWPRNKITFRVCVHAFVFRVNGCWFDVDQTGGGGGGGVGVRSWSNFVKLCHRARTNKVLLRYHNVGEFVSLALDKASFEMATLSDEIVASSFIINHFSQDSTFQVW